MSYAGIDTRKYDSTDTLFFIRILGAQQFFDVIYGRLAMDHLFGHLQKRHTLSEYDGADHTIDLGKYRLSDMTAGDWDDYRAAVHEALPSIIFRCRGLRAIDYAEARSLVLRTTKWALEFFRSQPYRLLVIHIIDNYVLDVLVRIARHLGLDVLVLSEWFIPPYRRQTFFGELHQHREPAPEEVDAVIAYCHRPKDNFWLKGIGRLNRLKYFAYLWARYLVLVVLRHVIQFRILGREGYEYRFAHVWRTQLNQLFIHKFFSPITRQEVEQNPDRFVVIPLHTFPEANVDYWMADWRDADYYTSLYEVISFFRDQGITVLIKEHPWFMYQRPRSVYAEFQSFGNVRIIDPFGPSVDVLDLVDLLVVWHGTMGIEGVVQGRRVCVYDTNYYSLGVLPSFRDYASAAPFPEPERRRIVTELLKGAEPLT